MKSIVLVFVGLLFVISSVLGVIEVDTASSSSTPTAPKTFTVEFDTTQGVVTAFVNRTWSPYGVDRFYALVTSNYYNDNAFFRVIQQPQLFVAQWGINGVPQVSSKWNITIPNDPVVLSNVAGTISFAAEMDGNVACCRTTQIYINYANNSFLDAYGFSPFAKIISGFDNTLKFYSGYGEQPDQTQIYEVGNSYLQEEFPKLDYLTTAKVVSEEW